MSEIGFISQYEKLVNTTEQVNNAIISLKKLYLIHLDSEKYSYIQHKSEDSDTAMIELNVFVGYLIGVFNRNNEPDYSFIPEKVLEKFRTSFSDPTLANQLKLIKKRLGSKKILDKNQFELLDRMVTSLDIERNKLFKIIRSQR